jgi:hypothetical protein
MKVCAGSISASTSGCSLKNKNMRQGLQLRLSQHLALTPQLQQSIRLLQLSTLELNAEIDQALQENPLLERDEPGPDAGTFASGPARRPGERRRPSPRRRSRRFRDERQEPQGGDDEGWGMDFSGSHGQRDPNDDDMDSGETRPRRPPCANTSGAGGDDPVIRSRAGAGRFPDRSPG